MEQGEVHVYSISLTLVLNRLLLFCALTCERWAMEVNCLHRYTPRFIVKYAATGLSIPPDRSTITFPPTPTGKPPAPIRSSHICSYNRCEFLRVHLHLDYEHLIISSVFSRICPPISGNNSIVLIGKCL